MENMSWELGFGLGVLILALVLGWGLIRNKTRNKANDPLTEAATRREYDHPADYDRDQHDFRRQTQR
jgi:hypothetical protein